MQLAPKSYGEIAKRASVPVGRAALLPRFLLATGSNYLWPTSFGRNVTRASFLIRGCCRKRGGRGTLRRITICQNRGDTSAHESPGPTTAGASLFFGPAATCQPRMTTHTVLSRRTVDFRAEAHPPIVDVDQNGRARGRLEKTKRGT